MNIPGVINYEHVQVHTVYIFEIETEFIHYPGIKCVVLFIVLMVPLYQILHRPNFILSSHIVLVISWLQLKDIVTYDKGRRYFRANGVSGYKI